MRKFLLLTTFTVVTALFAGNAAAEELRGRLAVTGRIGVTNPANSELDVAGVGRLIVTADPGILGGGGFLFGVDESIAVELDVTRSSYHTSRFGTAEVTTISMGAQYRFPERERFIPYGGAGLDVLINDLSDHTANTVLGLHLAAGVDYMLSRQVALNLELKGIEAYSAKVKNFNGTKVGELDPTNLACTVGARFFFN